MQPPGRRRRQVTGALTRVAMVATASARFFALPLQTASCPPRPDPMENRRSGARRLNAR
jgi:hypothetical protein